MKLRKVLLAGLLMITVSASAVFAEEAVTEVPEEAEETSDGILAALFGEGGPLEDVLPEGTSIEEMIDVAKRQLGEADQEISGVLDAIVEKAKDVSEGFSVESLEEYAGELLSQFVGGGFDVDSLEAYMQAYGVLREEENQYILDHNAELMESGDVQLISNYNIYVGDFEQEEFKSLCVMSQNNYTLNEENQLLFVSGGTDVVLFTQQNPGDGTYPVTDAVFAEDGEGYAASIEAMCEETGTPFEECMDDIEFSKVMMISDLRNYLNEHPEIAGLEYAGEIRTAEDLDELYNEEINAMFGEMDEEMLTEAMTEELLME